MSAAAFCRNLRDVLLAPPLPGRCVMGIDPGFSHGCKVAFVDAAGEVLAAGVVRPAFARGSNGGDALGDSDRRWLVQQARQHGVSHIAIGDGTACRETEEMVAGMIRRGEFGERDVVYAIVSEQGTSIYR